jgi:CBS domain-containing protein
MPHVGDLLTGKGVITLSPSATALQAALAMTEARVKATLVTEGSTLLGIFTEHDLMVRVVCARREPRDVRLSEVMTREIFSVRRDQKVAEVRRELQRRHISHLPVVEDGKLIGILSMRDILRADLEEKAHEVRALEDYFLGGAET